MSGLVVKGLRAGICVYGFQ